jgi:hypothetical protein
MSLPHAGRVSVSPYFVLPIVCLRAILISNELQLQTHAID